MQEDLRTGQHSYAYEVGDVISFSVDFIHYGVPYVPAQGQDDNHYRLFFVFGKEGMQLKNTVQYGRPHISANTAK